MNGRSIPPNDHNLSTAASDAAEIDAASPNTNPPGPNSASNSP
jgi:hypothetical protein